MRKGIVPIGFGALAALLVSPAVGHAPVPDPEAQRRLELGEPPGDMIDFLGRRRECAERAPRPGEPRPPETDLRHAWLRCGDLAREEDGLRRRYAEHAVAMAYLDQAPSEFELGRIFALSRHGPPAIVERSEFSGTDLSGRVRWTLEVDGRADGGRATSVTVSWGEHPRRTIYLDNIALPYLDTFPEAVELIVDPDEGRLMVELKYGFRRGWCGNIDPDDRPTVSIQFWRERIAVYVHDMANCASDSYEEVDADRLRHPPSGR